MKKLLTTAAYLGCSLFGASLAHAQSCSEPTALAKGVSSVSAVSQPLTLASYGSLMYGGSVRTATNGETFHGDHGYAQYYIPVGARALPVVMWHGYGQSGKTWETTPDGREGFDHLFPRHGWAVYVIDQPRRGRAGRTAVTEGETSHKGGEIESALWSNFRLGEWHPPQTSRFFPGVQVAQSACAMDQFLRQQTGNTGPEPFPSASQREFQAGEMVKLLRRTGPSILMTHSHSGEYGWETAMQAPTLVRAIIALEPGVYVFPENSPPPDIDTKSETLRKYMAPQLVPDAKFRELVKAPIAILFGDNIAEIPSDDYGIELWRMVRARASQFAEAVRRYGGTVEIIDLPKHGLKGNTHFMMSDLNNSKVADLIQTFLHEKHLDAK